MGSESAFDRVNPLFETGESCTQLLNLTFKRDQFHILFLPLHRQRLYQPIVRGQFENHVEFGRHIVIKQRRLESDK